MTGSAPPRPHNVTRPAAALLPALGLLLTAGCGGEATVVTETPAPAPTYQPTPVRPAPVRPAPRRERLRRGDMPPPAPVIVRDEPEEPTVEPDPPAPEPVVEPEPEPEIVRDDAYFQKLWAELPAPVAELPPRLEPLPAANRSKLRTELKDYLRKASAGHRLPKEKPEPGMPVNFLEYARQYRPFKGKYAQHKSELHALMERDVWLAEALLEQNEPAVTESAMGLLYKVESCAKHYVKDGRLAAAIAEVYIVPHLDELDSGPPRIANRSLMLSCAASSLEAGEFWERAAQLRAEQVRLEPTNRNRSDIRRALLARNLWKQGDRDHAVAVLNDIQDPGLANLRDHYLSEIAADSAK